MKSLFLTQHCVHSFTVFAIKCALFSSGLWYGVVLYVNRRLRESCSFSSAGYYVYGGSRFLQIRRSQSRRSYRSWHWIWTLMFWNLFLKGTSCHLSSLWYRKWTFLTLRMRPTLPYWSGPNLESLSPNFTAGDSHSMRNVFSWMLTLWQVF
jgi:hypothetical protein